MTCPSVKARTQYVAQCVCNTCARLCFLPRLWSLLVLALIRQLGTEWEHIKNQSPLQADGSSLWWQGQSTWTQACYSCAVLRKLGLAGLGFGFCCCSWFFSYFNSYKWVRSTQKCRHTYLKLQGTLLFWPWLDCKSAMLENIQPIFITVLKVYPEEYLFLSVILYHRSKPIHPLFQCL